MSTFTVRVELKHKKFTPLILTEDYTQWADADRAFCHYKGLTELNGSTIDHVELIEHREEVVHKAASKETRTNTVSFLEQANGTHG